MIRLLSLGLVIGALTIPSDRSVAQSDLPSREASVTIAIAPASGTVLAQTTPSGLPERPPAPRTLQEYWHLFIAYAVVWALLFGYALSLGRRFGRMEEELARLRGG